MNEVLEKKEFKAAISWLCKYKIFLMFGVSFSIIIARIWFTHGFLLAPAYVYVVEWITALLVAFLFQRVFWLILPTVKEWGWSISSHYIRYLPESPTHQYLELPIKNISKVELHPENLVFRTRFVFHFSNGLESKTLFCPRQQCANILQVLLDHDLRIVKRSNWHVPYLSRFKPKFNFQRAVFAVASVQLFFLLCVPVMNVYMRAPHTYAKWTEKQPVNRMPASVNMEKHAAE